MNLFIGILATVIPLILIGWYGITKSNKGITAFIWLMAAVWAFVFTKIFIVVVAAFIGFYIYLKIKNPAKHKQIK